MHLAERSGGRQLIAWKTMIRVEAGLRVLTTIRSSANLWAELRASAAIRGSPMTTVIPPRSRPERFWTTGFVSSAKSRRAVWVVVYEAFDLRLTAALAQTREGPVIASV